MIVAPTPPPNSCGETDVAPTSPPIRVAEAPRWSQRTWLVNVPVPYCISYVVAAEATASVRVATDLATRSNPAKMHQC